MAPQINEYERQRAERIAANAAKMRSLGITEAVQQLEVTAADVRPARAQPAPRKRKMYEIEIEVRRSGRLQGDKPEYNEENLFAMEMGIDRLDLISRPRRRRVGINPTDLTAIRAQRIREVDGEDAEIPRGPFDSGLGVRIQGGRVYDSKYGVTCHWCRQKTLEEHVTCSHPDCGGGRRLAVSFCKLCLKNRHGEDILQAETSGKWVCPRCRGSCGDGCSLCCNCGPCRRAAGLSATGQLINEARRLGFDNVHDFLVHRSTGETSEEIAARKRQAAWGAWLDVPFDAAAAAAARDVEREEGSEPAAAAATVQLAPPQRRRAAAAVPEGAGAALLVLVALRWHLLSAAFCTAVQKLAPAPKRGRPAKAATKQPAAATKRAAPKAAKAAPAPARRSSRGSPAAPAEKQQLPAKMTSFFQPKKVVAMATEPTAAAKVAAVEPPRPRGRLGMRSRK